MNKRGSDLLNRPAPATQNTHVTSTQIACVPIDAIGRLDHKGSRKNKVYVPEVTVVQQAENLFDCVLNYLLLRMEKQAHKRKRTPLRVMGSGALLLKRNCSNNQVASATYYSEEVCMFLYELIIILTSAKPTASKNTYTTRQGKVKVRQQRGSEK
jgi:hypothetical protein